MNTQPLFYKKVVPLSKENHSKLYIEPVDHYTFTKNTNSLYIAAIEFLKASKEYTIVFARDAGDAIFPAVLLGMQANQNLYLDSKGRWLANYIPAYVRRYPFILAENKGSDGNFAVCIDENHPGFNGKNKGQPLFNDTGEESDMLKQSIEFLKEYQNHIQLTATFSNNIKHLDILEPMRANVQMQDGEKLALGGFMGVSREKLKALPDKKLAELVKTDQMELINAHLNSLDNIETLFKRIQ